MQELIIGGFSVVSALVGAAMFWAKSNYQKKKEDPINEREELERQIKTSMQIASVEDTQKAMNASMSTIAQAIAAFQKHVEQDSSAMSRLANVLEKLEENQSKMEKEFMIHSVSSDARIEALQEILKNIKTTVDDIK